MKNGILNQFHTSRAIGRSGAEAEYTLLGPDDMLGKALMEMRSNMLANEQIVQARKQEEELRSWRNQGLAEFGRVLREKSGNAVELADELLQQLVKYLDALQGGFFLRNHRLRIVVNGNDMARIQPLRRQRRVFQPHRIIIADGQQSVIM